MKKCIKTISVVLISILAFLIPSIINAEEKMYEIKMTDYSKFSEILNDDEKLQIFEYLAYKRILKIEHNHEDEYSVYNSANDKLLFSYKIRENTSTGEPEIYDDEFDFSNFDSNDNISVSFTQSELSSLAGSPLEGYSGVLLLFKEKEGVYINKITQVEISPNTVVTTLPSVTDLNIDIDLQFSKVHDYALYEIIVKNNTDTDYVIDNKEMYGENNYIKYQFEFDNNDNILPARTTKKVLLKVSYDKEVPVELLIAGNYQQSNRLNVSLLTDFGDVINPVTNDSINNTIFLLLINLILLTLFVKIKKSRIIVSLLLISLIPYYGINFVNASEAIKITINSNVQIKSTKFKLVTNMGSFSKDKDVKEVYIDVIDDGYSYDEIFSNFSSKGKEKGLNISFNAKLFKDDSYINVYDNNHQLIRTITIDDIPRDRFDLSTSQPLIHDNINFLIPNYIQDIIIETSSDFTTTCNSDDCPNLLFIYEYNNSYTISHKGPWVTDDESIELINNLQSTLGGDHYLSGFTRCNIYEGETGNCTGNIFYAEINERTIETE